MADPGEDSNVTNRLIIGAASGMGEAVARRFARDTGDGDRLLLADVSTDQLEPLAKELGAEHVRCDITSDADVTALAETLGDIDAAVLTAGLSPTMADGRRIIEVNLTGTARVGAALLPRMLPGSAFVCFASTAGHYLDSSHLNSVLDDPSSPELYDRLVAAGANVDDTGMAYSVSKFGVRRYVIRSAAAWGARQARIVSLSPGIIATPMGAQEFAAQSYMKTLIETSALPRQGQPDEVAAVACFLVSPEASFLTGTDVLVDGGSVAGTLA
jgi:NAD(P)-dependent dehydrogenase (short-subunit alcohol dehydrogenase family)